MKMFTDLLKIMKRRQQWAELLKNEDQAFVAKCSFSRMQKPWRPRYTHRSPGDEANPSLTLQGL
jgi:hypothetical protein